MKRFELFGVVICMAIALASCAPDLPEASFTPVGDSLEMEGIIGSSTPETFQKAISENPSTKRLVLKWVPGSIDDEKNLELARMVRKAGLSTYIEDAGLVASGGTDLFLAGKTRFIAPEACVGVHTWGSEDIEMIGSEFPKDHESHEPYLAYYRDIQITEDFYWFTLKAAGPDEAYWMTRQEMNRFGMTTATLEFSSDQPETQERCDRLFAESWENQLETE